ATTGTAGPDPLEQPGHAPVPPGRVHAALARAGGETLAVTWHLPFERALVQRHAAVRALDLLRRTLAESALSPPTR
ncbi:MAG: CinA family protein, partial [Planctomycetota bacterium]|nr:CinA family protein [Planctomycetota bacterium]